MPFGDLPCVFHNKRLRLEQLHHVLMSCQIRLLQRLLHHISRHLGLARDCWVHQQPYDFQMSAPHCPTQRKMFIGMGICPVLAACDLWGQQQPHNVHVSSACR
eukprot:95198-Chlamydomonas_euryale.AAC.10